MSDLCNGRFARYGARAQFNKGFPESRPSDGKTYKPGDSCCSCDPMPHAFFVFSSTQHDATDSVSAVAACHSDNLRAILDPIQTFDFPHIGFDPTFEDLI